MSATHPPPTDENGATTSSDTSDLINPKDFQSIRIEVGMTNTTTGTDIREGRRMFTDGRAAERGEHLEIKFIEFLDRGVVLEIPVNACSTGHNLMLAIETRGAEENVKLMASGKVKTKEPLDETRDQIEVAFVQFEETGWQALMNIFSVRQRDILEFFKAVKGY